MKILNDIIPEHRPEQAYGMFINGNWIQSVSGNTIDSINPATGEKITSIPLGSKEDVDIAVKSAQKGFKIWSKITPKERQSVLLKIADAIEARFEKFAILEALDAGKPIRETRLIDIPAAIDNLRYFGAAIRAHSDESTFISENILAITSREPIGVVGQIIPWNFPLHMATSKLAPALASGNSVVIKPSELTSITILELSKILKDVLPPGVVNIVTGTGEYVGQAILDHPDIKKLAFTGSTRVGYKVAEAAAKKIIPATLELGGKSANIIFDDANLKRAVEFAIWGALLNQGQICEGGTRLFVQKKIYNQVLEELKTRFKSIKMGDPLSSDTEMGSQISEAQMNRILGYIDIAKSQGGTILTGGKRRMVGEMSKGFFIEPTIIINVKNSSKVSQEEIFGPVLVIIPFDTEEEVIKLANESNYGLAGAVWTQDINKAIRVSKAIKTGLMWINTYHDIENHIPFGGYKKSGLGRENHKMALEEYSQTKSIVISTDENPKWIF